MSINKHYSMTTAPEVAILMGDIVAELLSGGRIIDCRFDGINYIALVERDVKLSECKGHDDNTWKYAIYCTSECFPGFYHASSHNRTGREMAKKFNDEYDKRRYEVIAY